MKVDVEISTPGGVLHVPGVIEGNRVFVKIDPGFELRSAVGDVASTAAKRGALTLLDALATRIRGEGR